ncbi:MULTISPECIES: hypothetical protein [Actinoplanes]|uniref:Uncharacterized protein n=2 Tax=Actinoplanes TaxID=1865 RepID=A0A124GA12_9ACTN|nr:MULTISPECIES: hypothetical protein [Actinoplanes]KUL30807.1 hypothetical protein ADL15_22835 [Actinoplanes awajinensis subsp. mycoplanecinus]GIE67299.1 hypothetical protein Apa02nite_034070 [Actinoplanes palleronii]
MTETTMKHAEELKIPEELLDLGDEIRQTVEDLGEKLVQSTTVYRSQLKQIETQNRKSSATQNGRSKSGTAEIAEPTAVFGGVPYQFFDMIAVGPFQPIGGGPFRPNRIIRAGERAFLIAAIWRNPTPLGFSPGNPSAADVMAGQSYVVRGQTVNVNDVANGPDLGPVTGTFGGGFLDFHVLRIPSVPAPQDGAPRLLDISLTIDVRSVASGLPPFAGYASQWLQLDAYAPFCFPYIPYVDGPVVVPGLVPSFVQDTPVRVLIYS